MRPRGWWWSRRKSTTARCRWRTRTRSVRALFTALSPTPLSHQTSVVPSFQWPEKKAAIQHARTLSRVDAFVAKGKWQLALQIAQAGRSAAWPAQARLYEVLRALRRYREAATVYRECGLGEGPRPPPGAGAGEGGEVGAVGVGPLAPVTPADLAAQARHEEQTFLQLPAFRTGDGDGDGDGGDVGEGTGVVVVDSVERVRLAAAAMGINLRDDGGGPPRDTDVGGDTVLGRRRQRTAVVVGVDSEWRAVVKYVATSRAGAGILQLALPRAVFLFDLHALAGCPPAPAAGVGQPPTHALLHPNQVHVRSAGSSGGRSPSPLVADTDTTYSFETANGSDSRCRADEACSPDGACFTSPFFSAVPEPRPFNLPSPPRNL